VIGFLGGLAVGVVCAVAALELHFTWRGYVRRHRG
jgi:hypothetical protein